MKKRFVAKLSLLICAVLLIGMLNYAMTANAQDGVKVSDVEYVVNYKDAKNILLSNKKSIGSAVGTEVYLTYTVKSATFSDIKRQDGTVLTHQQGVVGTSQPLSEYPYTETQMDFNEKHVLLQEGYTYFYKFEITKEGFEYTIIQAKGDKATYVSLPQTAGTKKEAMQYFGVYFGQHGVTAQLTNVRCYDRKGNDLGIQLSNEATATYLQDVTYKKNTKVDHKYRVTVQDQYTFALGNKKVPATDTVFIEYTVESSDTKLSQTGLLLTQAPTAGYPYSQGNGYMRYDTVDKKSGGDLLVEGAQYIIRMQKTKNGFDAVVQRTYQGEKTLFTFAREAGEYNEKFNFFCLWFGDGSAYKVNFVLKDFKCYDSNDNNLGVQCGKKFTSEHAGQLEDYEGCEAVYYCEADNSIMALYADKTLKFISGEETQTGFYSITDSQEKTLTLNYGGGKEAFSYLYTLFTDTQGRVYRRLGSYRVSFETDCEEGVETQILSAANGFRATKPQDPTKEGCKFEGWFTSDGKEFDFEQMTLESKVLYAKWSGDVERQSVSLTSETMADDSPYISIAIAMVIFAVGIAGTVMLIRRGRNKNEASR